MAEAVSQDLKRTALYELHVEAGAKMVPFAGYSMPLNYAQGIVREHLHTRTRAGLFDVSHMGQVELSGDDPATALEKLVPACVTSLKPGRSRCTVLLNERAGIIDDMIVARPTDGPPGCLSMVFNASRKQTDCEHLERHLSRDCRLETLDDQSLLALQGPSASEVMSRLFGDPVAVQPFMSRRPFEFGGTPVAVSRCGYTGEDGYEISVPSERACALAKRLLSEDEVEFAGLGARDSLRMEAGLCLYGSDIDETTTPIEAGLGWMVSEARREKGGFPGARIILGQLTEGVSRRRVGIRPEGRVIARGGTEIAAAGTGGAVIGRITSGCFAPTLQGPISIGYVDAQYAGEGTSLELSVRGKSHPARIVALPFVETRYYRGNKTRRHPAKRGGNQ